MRMQVIPKFGDVPLNRITNGAVRVWVAEMLGEDLSAATTRKAVSALRQCLEAAAADGRLNRNPAVGAPLPSERPKPPRLLSQAEVARLVDTMPPRYRALVLIGAYGGLRWGEAAGLSGVHVDLRRSCIMVDSTPLRSVGRSALVTNQRPGARSEPYPSPTRS